MSALDECAGAPGLIKHDQISRGLIWIKLNAKDQTAPVALKETFGVLR